MPSGCSIRALWIINNQETAVFSRRFPAVEKQWKTLNGDSALDRLPTDQQLANAFAQRKRRFCAPDLLGNDLVVYGIREGSTRGYGIRVAQSTKGSDSWVDDPITRHVISLCLSTQEEEEDDDDDDDEKNNLLWPIVLHTKGLYSILVLPLVHPRDLKDYVKLCRRSDCGPAVGEHLSFSSLLLNISSITG